MVNLNALQTVLPISGLEAQWVAIIEGFSDKPKKDRWQETITFLEPPAGQHIPYVDARRAMSLLFKYQGMPADDAKAKADAEWSELKEKLVSTQRVVFYDYLERNPDEHIPVPELLLHLRQKKLVSDDVADFLDHSVATVVDAPIFQGPDNRDSPWSIATLPGEPPDKAMIEFVPGPPWNEDDDTTTRFDAWRDSMRVVADRLEKVLGEPVYYFKVLDCDTDDDNVHRFLVLHWLCMCWPESNYVKFLIASSGAKDVEEFKAALINPDNYTQPFKMNDAFIGIEPSACRLEYFPPDARKRVGIVFSTEAARTSAETLLLQKINCDVLIIAPPDLVPEDWVKAWTRHCRNWTIQYLREGILKEPIDVLAQIDELCVIAAQRCPKRIFDLAIPDSIEELLWLAMELRLDAKYFFVDGLQLSNPETTLEKRNVPQRVMAKRDRREKFTRQLQEIRLSCEFCSSGLWNNKGQMLDYDLLDLPFSLVRRIAAWQRDFDETENPPATGDDAWWDRHEQEEISIATALQDAVGATPVVKLYCKEGWFSVVDINRSEGEKP
jgi:hypothetical protein